MQSATISSTYCISREPKFVKIVCKRMLSLERKHLIVRLRGEKKSLLEISQRAGCSLATVGRVLRRSKVPNGIALKPIPGRKRSTTAREDRQLLRLYYKDRTANATALKMRWRLLAPQFGTVHTRTVTTQTVRNRLRSFGLKNYVKRKKAPLNARQRNLRVDFCLRHKDWTTEDWRKVIFSDECNVEAGPSGGCRTVWRKSDQLLSQFAITEVKSSCFLSMAVRNHFRSLLCYRNAEGRRR